VLVVGLPLAGPAAAQPGNGAASTLVNVSTIRIDNFGRINANYFRGAQPKGHDYADLAALGVKTVINLTSDDADASEKTMAVSSGMGYFQIPMTTHEPPTAAKLAEFLKIVNDRANQPVYVHCAGGRHRTGVMTAAYRMTQDGWTADQAFKEMKRFKFGADFLHPEFKQFVYGYRPEPVRTAASPVSAATPKAGG
jgi:protein tyrosine/serine phosphatase